jgi:hypothetical protein
LGNVKVVHCFINFSIVDFPYLFSNIPASPAYGVYISKLIRYARACSAHDQFLVRGSLLKKQVEVTRVSNVSLIGNFPQSLWSLQRSYLPIQPFFGPHAVLDTDLDYGSYRLPNLEKGLTAGVIYRQGMLTPP